MKGVTIVRILLLLLVLSLSVSATPLGLYTSNLSLHDALTQAGYEVHLVTDLTSFTGTLLLTDLPNLTEEEARTLVAWDGGQVITIGRIGSDPTTWEILQPLLGAQVLGWMAVTDGHFFMKASQTAPWSGLPVFISQKGEGALVLSPNPQSTIWATWTNSDGVTPTHLPRFNASIIQHSRGVSIGAPLLEGKRIQDPQIQSLLKQIIDSL